jgi:hypothetical protein
MSENTFDGGCLNCPFTTNDREELRDHNCTQYVPQHISPEQLAKVVAILNKQKESADEICENCDNGTDMPCVACQYDEFKNAYGMTK